MTAAGSPDESRGAEVVSAMLDAVERGDFVATRECFSPKAIIWHNFDEVDNTADHALEELEKFVRRARAVRYVSRCSWTLGHIVFVQHVLVVTSTSGEQIRIPAMMRLELNDRGQIRRLEEYLDLGPTAKL